MKNFVKYLFAIIFASATLQAQSISPNLEYGADSSKKSMKIQKAIVDVKIVGSLATTTIDLTFYNELDRTLEGEFNFPLGEAQSVSRFAMEINGKLREGVVVEKTQGRATFESIVRRGVDPGLLEQTKGNVFRSRVYPIFPRQSKRIVIAYEETLSESAESSIYLLPLDFKDIADTFQITAKVYGNYQKPNAEKSQIENATFAKDGDAYAFERIYYKYLANKPFEFEIPSGDSPAIILAENIKGQNYFEIIAKPEIIEREKPNPSVISIYWDASGSMIKRDIDKELALLDSYFQKIQNCSVNLNLFDISASPTEKFEVSDGDWTALKSRLQTVEYDGGSQLGAIDLSKDNANEILFFSDGMSDFGERELKLGSNPIYAINSNQSAEHSYLRYISQATGGEYINLLSQDSAIAQNALSAQKFSLISCTAENASEIYPSQKTPIIGAVSIAGKLNSSASKIILNYGFGSEIVKSDTLEIDMSKNAAKTGILNRIWAQKKIAELDARFETNKAEITKTAKEYSIVTRNTSLIVLETVWDYIRYKITPPEELKAEYDSVLKEETLRRVYVTLVDSLCSVKDKFNSFYSWYQDPKTGLINRKSENLRFNAESRTFKTKIHGIVTDENGVPVQNADVKINYSQIIKTNSRGEYVLDTTLRGGYINIFCNKIEYYNENRSVKLDCENDILCNFQLKLKRYVNLKGKITDKVGMPLSNVKICVNYSDSTRSDSKGEYQLNNILSESYNCLSIYYQAKGFQEKSTAIKIGAMKDIFTNENLEKITYCSIYGNVKNSEGHPIKNAYINYGYTKNVRSNDEGEYILDSIEKQTTSSWYHLSCSHQDYYSQEIKNIKFTDNSAKIDITMKEKRMITFKGVVKDNKGKILPDAVVSIGGKNVKCNNNGEYYLSKLIDNKYCYINCSKKGYYAESTNFECDSSEIFIKNFILSKYLTIDVRGYVIDQNGNPLENVTVYVRCENSKKTRTNIKGEYVIKNVALNSFYFDVDFIKDGYYAENKYFSKTMNEGIKEIDVSMDMKKCAYGGISGVVKDDSGKPLANVKLTIQSYNNFNVKTDANGKYSIKKIYLNDGESQNIHIYANNYGLKYYNKSLNTKNRENMIFDVILERKPTIEIKGKVLDDSGNFVEKATIWHNSSFLGVTDSKGEYSIRIEELEKNEYNSKNNFLYFEKLCYINSNIDINNIDLNNTKNINIELKKLPDVYKYANISGTVIDEFDNPVAGASVLVKNRKSTSTTDVDGDFSIIGIELPASNFIIKKQGYNTRTINQYVLGYKDNRLGKIVISQIDNENENETIDDMSESENDNNPEIDAFKTVDTDSNASSDDGDGVDYGDIHSNIRVSREENSPDIAYNAGVFVNDDGYYLNSSRKSDKQIVNDANDVGSNFMGGFGASGISQYATEGFITGTNTHIDKGESANIQTLDSVSLIEPSEKEILISKINSACKADFLKNYFELKKKYSGVPSFYIDASDAARNMGEKELSLKILSNLAEIQIEKQEIERVLGHRLRELGYADYAVESFSEVLKNREEEPQSYRDLAWAYCDKGEFQKAADLMYSIAKKDWDARFPEIETIALTEMNNIIQLSGGKVDISKYDSAFVKKLSFDLVVVLDWDMDNTDIDLWVTDPSGEKCYYGNRFTRSGGRISRDFTGGYGPEVFYIKNAPKGEYKIEANYFGSRSQKVTDAATLILDVYTKYGSPDQAKKTVLRRLTDQKEVIQVGKVTIN